ncbi:[protein-PII] uridylyltransferase [Sulfurirhabdus autotrophica]|uniref:Bifunctional uridylyltransferase/uridylyl-removing enzyme n=2 Tax=Sulfurirhabdus autotrophica TaxID=1706046 RepID=A0A4R3YHU4_9PROT|nr:[protein-PII] uridylyltransferase [Sulfurirhabdus autotrophica]TCV90173.1 UTP--GlnB (protein PII) uridylyltransferase GlnD [Sulfurirhabdus autotrophica]
MSLPISQKKTADWRAFLVEGRQVLRDTYLTNLSSTSLLRNHSRLVDQLLQEIWQKTQLPESISLLAVGGYGRDQLFPYSDVDILILLPGAPDENLNLQLEQLVALLWDTGLDVGHSVRTLEECREEAAKDITVQTNLLEARLIAGNKSLFQQFDQTFHRELDQRAFFEAKYLEQQQRHARFHDTAYNLEPNVKESPGGLRDLQNIIWISDGCGLGQSWMELAHQSIITSNEARQIRRHETLLENIRIRLHYQAKRREDRLLFDFQATLAQQFGFTDKKQRRASEQLMQRYYRTAKAISLLNEILLQNLRAKIFPSSHTAPVELNARFRKQGNLLAAANDQIFEEEPSAILECFLLLQQHSELKGMTASTLRALWRAKRLINPLFRRERHNRDLFMEILRQPRGVTHELRRMNQYGILGRYIPAFGRIVGQMQHDLYHQYTVDEHTLMVLRNLRRFTVAEFAHEFPLCSRLINSFERQEVLILAALFHDIAKGRGGDHSALGKVDARRFCTAHNIAPEDTDLVCWLVEKHLTMSATAQKQDISDPDVIASFAEKIKDQRHLAALYLLTVADIRGTSPKVWNAWKGKLLEDLFYATKRHLSEGTATTDSYLEARQTEAQRILRLYAIGDKAHEELWSKLDVGYFLRHDAQEIAWHTRLLLAHTNTDTPIVRSRISPVGEGLQVLIYSRDHDDLFARICGFFERTDYNIVEAKIHTTTHGYALDSFLVLDEANRSPHYRDLISYVEFELTERLTSSNPVEEPLRGRLSRHLKHFPIAPQVRIQADDKGAYHVLSITAGDQSGLLSRIAQIFVKHEIHLHTAKINTLGGRAEDIFLITGDSLQHTKSTLQLETDLVKALNPVT